jgi:biopolymer transport protein ExbD
MAGLDPPPRRRILFMLTPLVDVMFLLLIFFMLSSQTAPYSLLEILAGGNPAATPPSQVPPPQPTAPQGKGDVVFSIGPGYVRVNGARVAMADLGAEIARLKAAGFTSAVVFSSPTATVQDVVSLLETFQDSAFEQMRLVTQTGTAAP